MKLTLSTEQCSLGFSLLYRDSCPLTFQPDGFVDGPQWRRIWRKLDGRGRSTTFDTALHSVQIAVLDSKDQPAQQDTEMSNLICNMQNTSSRNLDLRSTQVSNANDQKELVECGNLNTEFDTVASPQVLQRQQQEHSSDGGSNIATLPCGLHKRKVSISRVFIDVGDSDTSNASPEDISETETISESDFA